MKILFLYTELADYLLSCINALTSEYNAEVHIMRFPVNKEAPFQFSFSPEVKIYDRTDFAEKKLIYLAQKISPDVIYCSGWKDNTYLSVCRHFRKNIPVILGMDNKWNHTIKQEILSLTNYFFIKPYFNYCWVPGNQQEKYAQKLGFESEKIFKGLYSADYNFFYKQHLANMENKKNDFPKIFIYAGRYYAFKGIENLWNAFIELKSEEPNDWDLWCLGTGDIFPIIHPNIKHFGFVQPSDIPEIISKAGVFILPSHIEPWGVALHEFASAGFPLISSSSVGANEQFLINGTNGYSFKSGSETDLKNCMKKIIRLSSADLFSMSQQSVALANSMSPKKWADTLFTIYKNHQING